MLDDGVGLGRAAPANGAAVNGHGATGTEGTDVAGWVGNGIAGLSERAERLRGRIEAGRRADGDGFRLAVSVPTAAPGASSPG